MNLDENITAEFGVTPAEYAVLMTVHHNIPLPSYRFVPHAVWEAMDNVTEKQVWEAFDSCLSKSWITLNEDDYPEFTAEGKKLWEDLCSAMKKHLEEVNARADERRSLNEAIQEVEQLEEWLNWSRELGKG